MENLAYFLAEYTKISLFSRLESAYSLEHLSLHWQYEISTDFWSLEYRKLLQNFEEWLF